MTRLRLRTWLGMAAAALSLTGLGLGQAQATPAFARSTGAACAKCHTQDIPRLNERGMRFLRNGFQIRAEPGMELSAPDDKDKSGGPEQGGLKKVAGDLWLNNVGDYLAMYVEMQGVEKSNTDKQVTLGQTGTVAVLASGTLAKDVPFWTELEYAVADGTWEADRVFIGNTNIGGTSLANVRIGSLDPTEWTAFSSLTAEAFKGPLGNLGSYEEEAFPGFAQVGTGLTPRGAAEYYGYTDNLLWAAGVANAPSDYVKEGSRNVDYYGVVDWTLTKGLDVSALYYDSRSSVQTQVWNVAASWRTDWVDLLGQYSADTGTDDREKRSGYTVQAYVPFTKQWMGVARYDATDNGADHDAVEGVASLGVLYKPLQNLKLTAAVASETQKAAGEDGDTSSKSNMFNVNIMYAM